MELSRLTPILLLIISTVSHTIEGLQYCYSCSSMSPLCRTSVWDEQHLSVTPCKSTCFLRTEGKMTYRGCFDGWLGGLVDHNYSGCKAQTYLGKTVEWCFCKTDSKKWEKDPCNGGSRKALAKIAKTSFPQRAFNEVKLNLLESSYGPRGKVITTSKGDKKKVWDVSKYYKSLPEDDKADSTHYSEYEDYEDAEVESNKIFESRPNNICSGRVDGQYVDEEDCSKYYICTNGVPYHMSCPAATMWNQILRGCSYSYHPLFPCKVQEELEPNGQFRLSFYPRKKPLFRIQRIDKQNQAFP